jgi:hypothetical protein
MFFDSLHFPVCVVNNIFYIKVYPSRTLWIDVFLFRNIHRHYMFRHISMSSSGASNSKDLRHTENLIFVKSITVIGDSYFTIL